MTYESVLAYFEADEASDRRLLVAADIAERFNATLIGFSALAARRPFVAEGVVIEEETEADIRARLAERETRFHGILGPERRGTEWQGSVGFPVAEVARKARVADLVVFGRRRAGGDVYDSLNPGETILRTGRPSLVVPEGVGALKAEHVVICWKDTREARRAVLDALPFLQGASRVFIAEVCQSGEEDRARDNIEDVARYLERHGIAGSRQVILHTDDSDTGQLFRLAQDEHADLLVSGAYGHSRLGEWVFGGVTRDLLTSSPVCCLMSH